MLLSEDNEYMTNNQRTVNYQTKPRGRKTSPLPSLSNAYRSIFLKIKKHNYSLLNPLNGACLCLLVLLISCQPGSQQQTANKEPMQKIQFNDYPNLKLGFTTQNFLQAMPVTLESSKQFVDYAAEQGYAWLELRDPDAVLTLEESKEIAAYAREKEVEVSYAIQKGLLDDDFWSTFEKGVKNAAVFDGPKLVRSLASGAEISGDTTRQGWTADELAELVQRADSAASLAQANGLQYVMENGAEAFFGDGTNYYGIADAFSQVGEDVGWQLDAANPFSVSRVHASPDSISTFLQEHIDNLFYIHLKSAQQSAAKETLTANPLAFSEIFQLLSDHQVPYIAIELQAVADQEQAFANMEKSIDYLQSEGFINTPN